MEPLVLTSQEQTQKLSELYSADEEKFAQRVTTLVQDNYDEYKDLRDKVNRNEMYWRAQHWNDKPKRKDNRPQPNEPVVHSTVENCIADAMDTYPDAIARGVNTDDEVTAVVVTENLRFVTQRAKHRTMYEKVIRAAVKTGTGVAWQFYNPEMANGLGDIDYKYYHIDNVFWDKNASDINEGRFAGTFDYISREDLEELYPDIPYDEVSPDEAEVREDRSEQDAGLRQRSEKENIRVINLMWKERTKRTVKIQNEEKDAGSHVTYIYSARIIGRHVVEYHAKQYKYNRFMFFMIPYIPLDNEPCGLSLIDLFKDDANVINLIAQYYLMNLQATARPRWLKNRNANMDTEALKNGDCEIIDADVVNENAIRQFSPQIFSGQALNYKQAMMGAIKEQTGQLDVNIGQSSAGVTAASAIMALQEYGSKRSRLFTNRCYEEHKAFMGDTLFLMSQHYTTARTIRISKKAADVIAEQKAIYEQQMMAEQQQAEQNGVAGVAGLQINGRELTIDYSSFDLSKIDPIYDIEIISQKKNAATSNLVNSMVQQGINSGSIPADMMFELTEFEGSDALAKALRKRIDMQGKLQESQQQIEQIGQQYQELQSQLEKTAKENEKLQKQVWQEKIRVVEQRFISEQTTEEEGEEEAAPETAEESVAMLKQEIGV